MKMILVLFVIIQILPFIMSSEGDRSPFYNKCLKNCLKDKCDDDGVRFQPSAVGWQDTWSWATQWCCTDECRYFCMWRTVALFQERDYPVPKFHGRWPFKKILGVQEPGSMLASLLNLAAHVYMRSEIVKQFPVSKTRHVWLWHAFIAVCINAWTWSVVFHTHDHPITEFMDYACALSMVIGLFVAAIVRVFHKWRYLTALTLAATVVYFLMHVRYLYYGRVDYNYNMMVNVVFGVIGSLIWVIWACIQYLAGRRYVWRVVAFAILSGVTLALELLDFPPYAHMWDAHAVWHLSTAPLPLLFYMFVLDDLRFLHSPSIADKEGIKLS